MVVEGIVEESTVIHEEDFIMVIFVESYIVVVSY